MRAQFPGRASHAAADEGTRVMPAAARRAQPISQQPEPAYDDEEEYEDERDSVAEALIRWVPPITAIVCAAVALCGFVYYQSCCNTNSSGEGGMPSPLFCMPEEGRTIMPEDALQAAFEIKTACDEISRRLLRWHWEHKPGAHSLVHCWITLHSASRKARTITTVCRIFPAKTAGSSWIPPFVCGFCWTRKRMPPNRWTCWAIPAIRVRPAAPAMLCAPPATKPPTPPITPMPLRRRSCSTRQWRAWKTAMWARLSARMNLPAITAMQKIIWHAAAQRSRSYPAVRRKKNGCARASPPEHKAGPEPQHPEPQNGRQPFLRQQKHHSAQQLGQKPQHGRPQKETEKNWQ